MPGASNLTNYLESQDKFGVKVKDWAVQTGKGMASCHICDRTVGFSKGKEHLIRHSENIVHRIASSSAKNEKLICASTNYK